MIKLTSAAILFLAAGIFTSVTILSAFQILFGISVAYYTYLAVKSKKATLPKSSWWLIAFLAVAVLGLIINHDLIPKPSKNWGRLKYYLYGIGGIYVLRVWLNQAGDKAKKILTNVFLISIIVAGLYASYEVLIKGEDRAKSLTDTMRYGYGSSMALLTLLSALIHKDKIKSWFDSRLGLIAFVIGLAGMYFTYTRGGLLGFICGLPVVLYFYKPKIAYVLGVIGIICAATLGYYYFYGNVRQGEGNRFLMRANNEGDIIRRSQWKAAIIAIKEKPMLGYGLSNFHSQLKRIKNDYALDAKYYNDAHSHNLFLEIASGTGLIGLFFFLGWLATWAFECMKAGGLIRALVVPFGVALIISSQFEVTLDANNASMIFFLYALSLGSIQDVQQS